MEEVTPKSGEWQREENDLHSMDTPRNMHRMHIYIHLHSYARHHIRSHVFHVNVPPLSLSLFCPLFASRRLSYSRCLHTHACVYTMHYSSARAGNSVSCARANDTRVVDDVSSTVVHSGSVK